MVFSPDARVSVQVIAVDMSVFDMLSNTSVLPDGSPTPSRISTLLDLSMELVKRYSDFRRPERIPLTERELFWSLTGETEQTLREGKLVTARVIWVQQNVAGLVTDNGAPHSQLMCCGCAYWSRRHCLQAVAELMPRMRILPLFLVDAGCSKPPQPEARESVDLMKVA